MLRLPSRFFAYRFHVPDSRTSNDFSPCYQGDLVDPRFQSIEAADIALAKTIWSMTPEASFFHPSRHEHGWDEVAANFCRILLTLACGDYLALASGRFMVRFRNYVRPVCRVKQPTCQSKKN